MVVAQEVRDVRGQELVRKGTVLDESILQRLAQRGVEAVAVDAGGGDDAGKALAAAEELHGRMFAPHAGNPLMQKIAAAALASIRVRHAQKGTP